MALNRTRVAIRNVKRLQQKYDNTARPDFRLRRDLNDARAYLESVKARDKATRKAKPERMRAQLIEAEKEAYESLTAADKAREAAERAKRTAEESRQELRSLRGANAPKSILEVAESREVNDRLAFRCQEDKDVAAEKELYEANARVSALQASLPQPAQDSKLIDPAEITDKPTSINGSEQQSRVSPPPRISPPRSSMVSYAAPQDDNDFDASDAEMHSGEDDGLNVPILEDDCSTFKVPE